MQFQRPDRICGLFPSTFKLARFVEIKNNRRGVTSPFREETNAVESFHDHLVPVNIHPPASNVCFVFFHLFGGSLMNSRPGSTKAVEFSFFETAGHIDYSQSVFVCFSAPVMPHSIVWKEKKVCLVNGVWCRHI